jgi:hypothetical protein
MTACRVNGIAAAWLSQHPVSINSNPTPMGIAGAVQLTAPQSLSIYLNSWLRTGRQAHLGHPVEAFRSTYSISPAIWRKQQFAFRARFISMGDWANNL